MKRDRRGFVLVAVLWLLVALGAVGVDAGLRNRSERLAAANSIDEARARAAAQAGAEYARSRLSSALLARTSELRSEASSRRRRRGRTDSVRRLFSRSDPFEDPWRAPEELLDPVGSIGDARYNLWVRDPGAQLHLNDSDYETLQQFFAQGLRIDAGDADAIANAILDWRDEDDLPWPNGGEREDYLSDGLPVLPPNRDFQDVSELRWVRGMTPEIYEMAWPYLTVVGSGDININAAPEPVLLAIPGMTPGAVTEILNLRESGITPREDDDLFRLLPDGVAEVLDDQGRRFNARVNFTTTEVEILSEGWVDGSPVRATVQLIVSRSDLGAAVVWRKSR